MSLADNQSAPSEPTTYAVYRAFYILPSDILPSGIAGIDFFVRRAADGLTYENTQYLGRADNTTGLYWVHSGLDDTIYYAYHLQYIFKDGSRSLPSEPVIAGPAQLSVSGSLNVDNLANIAYNQGLITSGIFQGVIFRTGQSDPKVQMDPTGIWATDGEGNIVFYLHEDGGTALFQGDINLKEGPTALSTATPASVISWGGSFYAGLSQTRSLNVIPGSAINPGFSKVFVWQNWGFNIPSDAVVTGITFLIARAASGLGIFDLNVEAARVRAPTRAPTDQSTGAQWPTSSTLIGWGSSTDTWGWTDLTGADVNDPGFHIYIWVQNQSLSAKLLAITSAVLIINYTVQGTLENSSWIQGVYDGHHKLVAGADGTNQQVTIIDDAGSSSFIQVPGNAADTMLQGGSVTCTWNGASAISSAANINHNFGRVPASTVCSAADMSDLSFTSGLRLLVRNGNPSTVTLITDFTPANGTFCTVYWTVVG